ncbi:MAG TPA: VOC family protein [Nitrososphaerales archaeon]|nr:VOC family protein [Nitrososphaerales archaeon]
MDPQLTPYLTFNGMAAEAMKFYHAILGGELTLQTFAEAKMANSPAENNLIVHAVLKNEGLTFMASDAMPSRRTAFGDNVHMSVTGHDGEKLTKIFHGLAEGGKVDMPLAKQFWGDTYGQLTDKFGVHWMVNITSQPQQ